ncbi:MAG: hypothetical protein KatS3mg111_2015 [Pirellulaceae bacterium]|nr:MAG: hypothetical protein KatS3mg111_2015 [Pirellulaceae bacterium]
MKNLQGNTPVPATPPAKPVKRVISKRLRVVLIVVLTLFSLLLANGLYLATITWLQVATGEIYEDLFYQYMFMAHVVLGLLLIGPVVVFGVIHMLAAWNRRNRRAVKIGYALFACALAVLVSGIALTRSFGFELKHPTARNTVYWMHVITPLTAMWLYWLHRLVGPRIKWHVGRRIAIATAVLVGCMVWLQMQDPRRWHQSGPKEGAKYFEPSLARTATGNFIPARALQNDEYCMRCHQDIYENWYHSAHRFSSFNNPAYLYAVRETRRVALERDGNVQASRWCAGCHDPVPFFSGAFDDPNYDDVNDPTSQAGITCTVCHGITHVNSNRGNADYVIDEPIQYPFTYSDHPLLQQINSMLVKAKPGFHKKTYLKPFHKTAEFCSVCHKVHLPKEVTAYKEFLRGQNHYDSYLLSGVSGHGASSFYYPDVAQPNCNECHMPQQLSQDFGAKWSDKLQGLAVHDHFFPGANTALPWWRGEDEWVQRAQELLTDVTRVDIFGLRKGGHIDDPLIAPLGPEYPLLEAGERYLLETVIRTTRLGHHLTQGTVDSNELWLDVTVRSGDRILGRSGGLDAQGESDRWGHFVNVFMLDRHGNRISRRNAQDIFIPLYNHQIPPGAAATVHYGLQLPDDLDAPIEIIVRLNYRKFDKEYLDFMNRDFRPGDREFRERSDPAHTVNRLPITVMAEDRVVLGVKLADGRILPRPAEDRQLPEQWQRWNDYGIGMLLAGRSQRKAAAEAFRRVESLGRYDGPLNLARVLFAEGDLEEAAAAVQRAANMQPAPPPWTIAWLSGEISRQLGDLEAAESSFRSVLEDDNPERRRRGFDFSLDYRVRNLLGLTLIDLAEKAAVRGHDDQADSYYRAAVQQFEQVLAIDTENVTAHANLASLYDRLGEPEKARYHQQLHLRYKPDDNAADLAQPAARRKYPAANRAAEELVIYWLHRRGAPELPPESQRPDPYAPEQEGVPAFQDSVEQRASAPVLPHSLPEDNSP